MFYSLFKPANFCVKNLCTNQKLNLVKVFIVPSSNFSLIPSNKGVRIRVRWSNKWNSCLSISPPEARRKNPADERRKKIFPILFSPAPNFPHASDAKWYWRINYIANSIFARDNNLHGVYHFIPRWFDLSHAYSHVGKIFKKREEKSQENLGKLAFDSITVDWFNRWKLENSLRVGNDETFLVVIRKTP